MSSADLNPYAAPRTSSALKTVAPTELRRDGKLLLVRGNGAFPNRCIRCNEPGNSYRLTRTVSWHHPMLYLLILLGGIVYFIVASGERKSVRIRYSLCPKHVRVRRAVLLVAWLEVLAGVGLMAYAIGKLEIWPGAIVVIAGVFIVIIAYFFGTFAGADVEGQNGSIVAGQHSAGAGPEFLASLPAAARRELPEQCRNARTLSV